MISTIIGYALSSLAGIAALVCFIIVVIKLFKKEGVGLGILGIICGIWTFIWGWMNAKSQDIKKIMLIWSVAIVVAMIGNFIAMAGAASVALNAEGGLNKAIQEAQQEAIRQAQEQAPAE